MTTLFTHLKPTDFINRKQAAEYLGLSFNTLTCWASQKKGPPFYKHGKCATYRVSELDTFREKHRIEFEHVPN